MYIDGLFTDGDRIEDIRLPSLDECDCREAVMLAASFVVACPRDEMHKHYGEGGALCVRFILPNSVLYEDSFYDHVRRNHPGAVPELRALIEKFVAYWDPEFRSGSVFAAFALAFLDQASLPLVARYFKAAMDGAHSPGLDEAEVYAIAGQHGWTLPMVEFAIAWFEVANAAFPMAQFQDRLLPAAKKLMSGEEFARRYHEIRTRHGHGVGHHPGKPLTPEYCSAGFKAIWGHYIRALDDYYRRQAIPFGRARLQDSFEKILNETSWLELARTYNLDPWVRAFLVTYLRIADTHRARQS